MAVLKGEGFPDPESELEWRRRLKRSFIERFGSDSVSADEFESDEDQTGT